MFNLLLYRKNAKVPKSPKMQVRIYALRICILRCTGGKLEMKMTINKVKVMTWTQIKNKGAKVVNLNTLKHL